MSDPDLPTAPSLAPAWRRRRGSYAPALGQVLLVGALVGGCTSSGTLGGSLVAEPAGREPWGDDPVFDAVPEQLPPSRPTGEGALFGAPGVLQLDLHLNADAIEDLTIAPREWARVGFGFREHYVFDAGAHLKGFLGSFRDLTGKSAWKVNFDHFVEGQEIEDVEGITLNNQVQDASKVHEVLGYHFYGAVGLPAPRTGHAHLRVNGESWGLYLVLEPIDDDFLERYFDNADGNLYDVNWFSDLYPGGEWDFELDEDDGPADRSDLRALIEAVQAPPGPTWLPGLEAVLDVDAFVQMMVADAMLGHWDGYGYNVNNFRIYCEPGARCTFMPWGIDQTFNDAIAPTDQRGELPPRCVADAGCRQKLVVEVQRQIDLWRVMPFEELLVGHSDLVRPWVEADPRREHSVGDFEGSLQATRAVYEGQAERMQAWLDAFLGN